jgi:hypothetical protein
MGKYGAIAFCLAGLLVGCDQSKHTGAFNDRTGEELLQWSKANPPVSAATWAKVSTITCHATSGSVCGPAGCKSGLPAKFDMRSVWLPNAGKYRRCGGTAACDDYAVNTDYSGAYANVSFPGRAMFAKVTASGEFVEVLSQMDMVIVYHGKCQTTEIR